jgi:hypothetical protein
VLSQFLSLSRSTVKKKSAERMKSWSKNSRAGAIDRKPEHLETQRNVYQTPSVSNARLQPHPFIAQHLETAHNVTACRSSIILILLIDILYSLAELGRY